MLTELLSSQARAEVFRLLFGVTARELHLRDIERRSGLAVRTVQRELQKLTRLDLVIRRRDGNRVYYTANRSHPLYREIHNIVLKTSGLTELLQRALQDLSLRLAFVFGSMAREDITAESDVDLLVVGDPSMRDLLRRLTPVSEEVEREINPVLLSEAEFTRRRRDEEAFLARVMNSPRLFIVGTEDDLRELVREPLATATRN